MLRPAYEHLSHFYIINDRIELPPDMSAKTYFIRHAERDIGVVVNLWEVLQIVRRERPTVMLSTGAGPAVPAALVGRLFGITVIYVETITRVSSPSLTGRLMYHLAHRFYYQWPELARFFPSGRYAGSLI